MFEFPWGRKETLDPLWSSRVKRYLVPAVAGIAMAMALAACAPAEQPPEASEAVSTDAVESELPAAPAPETEAVAPEASEEITSTAPVTPTTPVPPKPTPTPAPPPPPPVPPSAALQPAASDLAGKLTAFRAAVRDRDMGTMLRLQRELSAAADQASDALKDDKSPEASTVRLVIADIRKGVAGDNNALDHAEGNLRGVISGQDGAAGFGFTANTQPLDSTRLIASLNDDLRSFQQAVKDRNSENALRLQGQLLSNVSQAEREAKADKSEKGTALQAALSSLRKGLDGDTESLAAAGDALGRLVAPANAVSQPDQDFQRIAASLRTKLDDFRAAAAGNSRTDLLRLQQEIIAAVDQQSAALASDPSSQAKAMKDALAAVRAGVSGDLAKLDSAHSALSKLVGDQQSQANGAASEQPALDLPLMAGEMKDKIAGFKAAVEKNDTGGMLQLQSELLERTDKADAALKEATSKPAQEMRSAIASLRTAFAGDLSKLDEAIVHLNAVTGGTATPAGGLPAAKGATSPTQTDLQPLANELRNKLGGLEDATDNRTLPPEELGKQQAAVRAEAEKLNEALKGITDPRADRLRSAATAASEAAGGDQAKIEAARKLLDEALK